MLPPRLRPGDRVRFVSPASPVPEGALERSTAVLEALGLHVEYGRHVYDTHSTLDYLAGSDEDRLSDVNEALRDPGIKAIIATRGGKGAYRIADGLDVEAAGGHPKLVVGFSEITILHMALMKACGLVGIHGAAWDADSFGPRSAESFVRAVTTTEPIHIRLDSGRAHARADDRRQGERPAHRWEPGFDRDRCRLGIAGPRRGNTAARGGEPAPGSYRSPAHDAAEHGHLKGIAGVAVGQYTGCGSGTDPTSNSRCTEIDVLRDRLTCLGVPVLGGLPIGHGEDPVALPIGTIATLDADAGTLTVESGVT